MIPNRAYCGHFYWFYGGKCLQEPVWRTFLTVLWQVMSTRAGIVDISLSPYRVFSLKPVILLFAPRSKPLSLYKAEGFIFSIDDIFYTSLQIDINLFLMWCWDRTLHLVVNL
jgi:hypothetical protein